MIQFVCYFFPALLALRNESEMKEAGSKYLVEYLTQFAFYTLFINGIIYASLYLFTAHRYRYFMPSHFNVSFTLQYLIYAVFLSWLLPMLRKLTKDYMSFKVKAVRKR